MLVQNSIFAVLYIFQHILQVSLAQCSLEGKITCLSLDQIPCEALSISSHECGNNIYVDYYFEYCNHDTSRIFNFNKQISWSKIHAQNASILNLDPLGPKQCRTVKHRAGFKACYKKFTSAGLQLKGTIGGESCYTYSFYKQEVEIKTEGPVVAPSVRLTQRPTQAPTIEVPTTTPTQAPTSEVPTTTPPTQAPTMEVPTTTPTQNPSFKLVPTSAPTTTPITSSKNDNTNQLSDYNVKKNEKNTSKMSNRSLITLILSCVACASLLIFYVRYKPRKKRSQKEMDITAGKKKRKNFLPTTVLRGIDSNVSSLGFSSDGAGDKASVNIGDDIEDDLKSKSFGDSNTPSMASNEDSIDEQVLDSLGYIPIMRQQNINSSSLPLSEDFSIEISR